MGYREVAVEEIREVLRLWMGTVGEPTPGLRTIASHAGVDRKTVRRYIQAAQAAGLTRESGAAAITDEVIGQIVATVRPGRPNGHGAAWETLTAHTDQISRWVAGDDDSRPLTLTKIHILLTRRGVQVPYRTLARFAAQCCGYRTTTSTVRVADGEPGRECQIDFGYLGMLTTSDGTRRKVHALVITAAYSRHTFVWLTHSQTLAAVIAGCTAAWEFFGGIFPVIICDNMKPIVTRADSVNPQLSRGWLDYMSYAGFVTDTARVRTPQDKPRVERTIAYVQTNFWAGETFTDLTSAQLAAEDWSATTAGTRIHGTTGAMPIEVFSTEEQALLLCIPTTDYDIPVFSKAKVAKDFHASFGKALYSLPETWIGTTLDIRADTTLVKFFHRGELVKTHDRQPAGGRSTDPNDYPEHKTPYAMRNITAQINICTRYGPNIGIYAARLVDDPRPWGRMRAVYTLIGQVKTYGPGPVDTACATALSLDVISVTKIASMLTQATENTTPTLPAAAGATTTRFSRDPSEFSTAARKLTIVPDPTTNTDSEGN